MKPILDIFIIIALFLLIKFIYNTIDYKLFVRKVYNVIYFTDHSPEDLLISANKLEKLINEDKELNEKINSIKAESSCDITTIYKLVDEIKDLDQRFKEEREIFSSLYKYRKK